MICLDILFKYTKTMCATRSGKQMLRFSSSELAESLMWKIDIFQSMILIHCCVMRKSACWTSRFDCNWRSSRSLRSVELKNSHVLSPVSVSIAWPKVRKSWHKSVNATRPGGTSRVSSRGRSGFNFNILGRSNRVVWPLNRARLVNQELSIAFEERSFFFYRSVILRIHIMRRCSCACFLDSCV